MILCQEFPLVVSLKGGTVLSQQSEIGLRVDNHAIHPLRFAHELLKYTQGSPRGFNFWNRKMTIPVPKAKSNEFIKEINAVGDRGITPERLAEIEVEAIKLEKTDYSAAMVTLGVISSIKRDLVGIDKYFTNALDKGDRSSFVIVNYATALAKMAEFNRAIDLIDEAAESDCDPSVLKKACDIHIDAYDIQGATMYLDLLLRMGIDNELEPMRDYLTEIEKVFSLYGVDWHMATDRVSHTTKAILGVTKTIVDRSVFVHDGIIVNQYVLEDDVENAAMAESAMLDAIANQPFDPVDNIMSFSCTVQ